MKSLLLPVSLFVLLGCIQVFGQDWDYIKRGVSPTIELTDEFDSVYRQPLSGLGWEDGIHISEDGLHLYCTYVPIDILSFSLNGELPDNFSSYQRGASDFDMDLTTSPTGSSEWLHADILYAERASVSDSFQAWQLSNMARPIYSEGAPSTFAGDNTGELEFFLFTSIDNPTNNMDIWMITDVNNNPSGIGQALPAPVNTLEKEDNPNLMRTGEGSLLLFFDSDKNGSVGDLDLWYSISQDDGDSWTTPVNVSSINTPKQEHQPFVYYDQDRSSYYIYYSAPHTDGKLAIFRRKQIIENNWDSWGAAELVISAGNSAGIGEPTVTQSGDISFVVVYDDPDQNALNNRFDADPWYLRKRPRVIMSNDVDVERSEIRIFLNSAQNELYIDSPFTLLNVKLFDSKGRLHYDGGNSTLVVDCLSRGVYCVIVETTSGTVKRKILIK